MEGFPGAGPPGGGGDFPLGGDSRPLSGGRGRGRSAGFRGTAENAKTKICNRWEQGDCRFGDRCNFAHGVEELRTFPGLDAGGRGDFGGRGRGYGGRGGMPGAGRGYGGGRGAYGGYPAMGAPYQGYGMGMGMGMEQPALGGYEQRPAGVPDDVWAAQGFPVGGPNNWCMYRTKDTGEPYFHNHRTGVTTWERPADWPGP